MNVQAIMEVVTKIALIRLQATIVHVMKGILLMVINTHVMVSENGIYLILYVPYLVKLQMCMCVCVCVCERERDRERETDRQT